MASIGSIVGGAVGVVRDRPGAVAAWGVTYLVGSIALVLLIVGLAFALGFGAPTGGYGSAPQFSGGIILEILLFYVGYFLLLVILMNAVFRTILRPEERSFFSLRLGMDEWRMLGLLILVAICSIILMIVVQLLMMLLGFIIALLAQGSPAVAAIGAALLFIGYLCGFVWLGVRLSLLYPLTFHRRAITLDEAWSLTRGRFWTLFGAYLVIVVVLLVVCGTFFWLTLGGFFAEVARAGNDPVLARQATEEVMARIAAVPLAVQLLVGLLWAVFIAVGSVVWHGMLASAARELLLEQGEVIGADAESTAAIFE
ncbi:MAG: hypothetical protein V4574_07895 [Pseudomonadota bacterium]